MSNQSNKTYNFPDALAKMAGEIKRLWPLGEAGCYREPTVQRIEIPIAGIDQLAWLSAQRAPLKIYGAHQSGLYAIAGVGVAVEVEGKIIGSYDKIFARMRLFLRQEYEHLQFYGGFCFDDENLTGEWLRYGAYRFVIPQFEIARKADKMFLACTFIRHGDQSKTQEQLLRELGDLVFNHAELESLSCEPISREDIPNRERWQENIQQTFDAFRHGDYQKIVLARKTVFRFHQTLNPWAILRRLKSVTPNSYHFCFQFDPESAFLGASPERLFWRCANQVESEAVAGTRPRGETPQEDQGFKDDLAQSDKDQREHQFVVDAIGRALKPFCLSVESDGREILSLGNGHHLVTHFHGELREGVRDEQIIESMHPTPAVGGTPKHETLKTIQRLEPFVRGWYAAPIGYVGFDRAEFVVAIRSARIKAKELAVYAGAGIVDGSNPDEEWQEIEHKIGNFLRVLS